jgi:hypothetical protein
MAYPVMTTLDANISLMQSCGFEIIGHFALPESTWWDQYLHPMEERLRILRELHAADSEKLKMIEAIQMEIEIYRKYSSYYGLIFFLMRKK